MRPVCNMFQGRLPAVHSPFKPILQAAKACAAPSTKWDGPPVRRLFMRNRALVAVPKVGFRPGTHETDS
jgi:hypothetical protein